MTSSKARGSRPSPYRLQTKWKNASAPAALTHEDPVLTCLASSKARGSNPSPYRLYAEKKAHLAPSKSAVASSSASSRAAPSRHVRIVRCPLQLRMTERPAPGFQRDVSPDWLYRVIFEG